MGEPPGRLARRHPLLHHRDHLGRELVQLTAQYLFTWLFYYLQSYLMASVAESLVLSLRSQVARKLHRLPLRFFDQNKAGEILSRVTSDLDKISETLQTGLLKLMVAIGTIIGSLIVMFYYSLPLTGMFLVFMGISMLITRWWPGGTWPAPPSGRRPSPSSPASWRSTTTAAT